MKIISISNENEIPKPEIIYSKEYTVYGAGKLK